MQSEHQIRHDQQAHGRNMTDWKQRGGRQRGNVQSKGHEAFLQALQVSQAIVTFEKASNGEKVTGRIKASDKFTISVMVPLSDCSKSYMTRVLFKHDISEFSAQDRSETH